MSFKTLHRILPLIALMACFCPQGKTQDNSCLRNTTMDTNFWVAFTPNAIRINNGQHNVGSVLSLIATGNQSANITVSNSQTGWSQTFTHTGGTKTYIQLPSYWDVTSGAPGNMCYHVVSTQPIFLFASNFFKDSWDICNVLPERALGCNYIIQDISLSDNPFAPCLVIAATQDATSISCVLPVNVHGLSLSVGDTFNVVLNRGQSLLLRSASSTTFCGMPITSNKPIAVFQGHSCALIGASGGRDLNMEQARPIEMWGTQFVATSTLTRTEGDVVLVTSSADNCVVEINGTPVTTLAARQTYSYTMPSSTGAALITTSKPSYACLYPWSYNNGRTLGDPASTSLNPVDRWTCESYFPVHNCNTDIYDEQYISDNHHYINIVVPTSAVSGMLLDGNPVTGFSPLSGGFSYARQAISIGAHHLQNSQGNFFASLYGLGKWVAYGFETGIAIDEEVPLCPDHTTAGRDFWAAFLVNGGTERPQNLQITAFGDTTCSVTVSNPLNAWQQTVTLNAGSSVTVPLTEALALPQNYSMNESKGIHITSDADIQVVASFTQLASSAITGLLPTKALSTNYIILDYPTDPSRTSYGGATITIVATEPNTTISYIPPCPFYNDPSSVVGSPVTRTFTAAGQTLTLMSNQANASLSGMKISSDKPIAVFQGNQLTGVTHGSPSSDLMYDQALPVEQWGYTYGLVPTAGRSVGDRVRVVADSACSVTLSSGSSFTLTDGGVHEFDLPATSPCILSATKPVSVGFCSKSSDWNAEPGDASLLMVPPMEHGLCHTNFVTFSTQRIHTWYLVAVTDQPATMSLDGNSIASQFQPIGSTGFSYARISVSSGAHSLDNSNGTFTAWTYGVGNVESYIYSLGQSVVIPPTTETAVCPDHTTKGRDFWMMFLYNHNIAGTYPQNRRLYFASTDTATVNVHNNLSGNDSFSLTAPDFRTKRDYGNNQLHVATAFEGGYHITSSSDIWLYARNWMESTLDMAMIMPTEALGTRYIVQDYPSTDSHGGEVGFVATQDSTILTMTVPCAVQGTSITAGTTLTVPLNQGQAYMLLAVNNGSFSGMEVTSNNKPFAMFQGTWNNAVPQNANARDHCYEQALPVKAWGKEFIFGSIPSQSSVNHVRITTTENNTIIQREGASNIGPLPSGTTWQGTMSNGEIWHLTSSHPIQVILYMGSCDYANNIGDPSSVTILPLDRTICDAYFCCDYTERIGNSNHYVNIVCHEDYDAGLILDGNPIGTLGTVTVIGNYRYHTVQIPYTNANQGFHRLQNNIGPFWAFAYGYSYNTRESYAFPLGCEIIMDSVPEPQIIRDTVNHYDTVCQGHGYNGYGFDVTGAQTAVAGNIILTDSTTVDDTLVRYTSLTLTVLPNSTNEVSTSIVVGDTLVYCDSVITLAGDYIFTLTAANGCDSIIMLHITYQTIGLSASANGVCPGEEVTLTAEGTHIYYWGSTPYDPELASQQGQNPITVHPSVTTTYQLRDASGVVIASITVSVEPPPTLCIETNRDFIDFDHPVITLHDCSPDRYSSTWIFSDGYTLTGERARRQFVHPLPDTVTVTLRSCNSFDCCVDTTIGFRPEIRSIWFPNIFTPDQPQNNRFGPVTSCQVAEFEIFLYNRWGLLVWHTTDPLTPWDGTHDGTPVPQGAYAYRWYLKDLHGDRWSGTGTVTLIR